MTRHVTSVLQRGEGQHMSRRVLCSVRWFCSKGGLTRHRCRRKEVVEDGATGGVEVSQGQVTDIFQVKEAHDRKTKLNLLILDHY